MLYLVLNKSIGCGCLERGAAKPVLVGKGFVKEAVFELEFCGAETWLVGVVSLYSLTSSYPPTQGQGDKEGLSGAKVDASAF